MACLAQLYEAKYVKADMSPSMKYYTLKMGPFLPASVQEYLDFDSSPL